MEHYQLRRDNHYPELYHIGCTGTRLQIFLSKENWLRYVALAGAEGPYAGGRRPSFAPPRREGGSFGFNASAEVNEMLDGVMCVEIPIFSEKEQDERIAEMEASVRTISSILFVLEYLLFDVGQIPVSGESLPKGVMPQLFCLGTCLGEYSRPGSYGITFTVSPCARRYLGKVGNEPLVRGPRLMREHYERFYTSGPALHVDDSEFTLGLRRENVLTFKTPGNCACLGSAPPGDPEEGYSTSSHNIDGTLQQTNLLVGIAFVWQTVRDGVLAEMNDA